MYWNKLRNFYVWIENHRISAAAAAQEPRTQKLNRGAKSAESFGFICFSFRFGGQQRSGGVRLTPPWSYKHAETRRIRRRAGPGGASGRRTAPRWPPGTGTRPRRWPPPPPWCWRPGRTISPTPPRPSAAGSPTEEEGDSVGTGEGGSSTSHLSTGSLHTWDEQLEGGCCTFFSLWKLHFYNILLSGCISKWSNTQK